MIRFFKEFVFLFFAGGDVIQKKADEIRLEREKRFIAFQYDKDNGKKYGCTGKKKRREDFNKMNNFIVEVAERLGFAPDNDLHQLNREIADLKEQINKLLKEKKRYESDMK